MPRPEILDRVFAFVCDCVRLYQHLSKRGGAGRALSRQFIDAATSVGSNMEEGYAASSKSDFIAKESIALKEARETHYWLRIFERCHLADPTLVEPLSQEANELVAILTTIVKKARSNPNR